MATAPATAPATQVPQRTGQSDSLANWAGPYVTNMLGQGQAFASAPRPTYSGPLTAGASNIQNNLFNGLGSLQLPGSYGASFTGSATPVIPNATLNSALTPDAGTGIASQYMNPYLMSVLSPQLKELRRQADITQMNNAAKLTQAGAFGGSRQAIMDSELQRNLLDQMDKTIGAGYASAFDAGRNQFNTEQTQGQSLANTLANVGAMQRDIESEGVMADKKEFEEQRDYPMKMVQFQQSLLQGLPISAVNYSMQQPSGLTDFLNTTGGILDLYEKLFPGTTIQNNNTTT